MAKFKVVTTEMTTYVHYVEVPDGEEFPVDWVYDNFDESSEGEEVEHDFQIDRVEEVK
jgi:hypothetical protein